MVSKILFYMSAFLLVILEDSTVTSKIQSFSFPPSDSEVIVGHSVTLPCRVANQAGLVQWSKDGELLGFDPSIPGFPHYSLVGNSSVGVYDLQIVNASMEDESDFECQVGPTDGQEAIAAKAHLTILFPPTSIQIIDRPNGSVVQVRHSERVSLECEVRGGKPAPKVAWNRNFYKLSEDDVDVSIRDEADKKQVVVSTLNLNPTPDDNRAYYSCETESSLTSEQLTAGVILDVLYPPGRPSIEGYRTREKIRSGDTVRLRCISRGGNPLARLVWTKNGLHVDHSYTTSDWEAENQMALTAGPDDDGAVYACNATSVVSEPMQTSVTLKVLYAPSSVSIKAPKEAKPGDVISATCRTERSNPAAEITWVVDGLPLIGETTVEVHESGGWTTVSKINVNVTQQDRNMKLFTCYAVNQELGETVPQTFSVSILYAPDAPNIFGYVEGIPIHAGKLQRLTCISQGGNPLPDLKWYKEDKELSSADQSKSGNIISRELAIVTEANDNGAKYHCKSSSKALAEPLVATTILTVYFPPSTLQLKVKPKKPKADSEIRLICESSGSNPASNVTWWTGGKNQRQLTPIQETVDSSKENGGFTTKAVHAMTVTADDDGGTYTCQATNEAIQQSIHDSIVLAVYYKPIFPTTKDTFEVRENSSEVIDMTARANPDKVTYQWRKGNDALEEGPFLNITAADRSQSGEYTCSAKNEIGETSVTVVVKILYPAMVSRPSDEMEERIVVAEPESNVRLLCEADGYPLTDSTITWNKDNLDVNGRVEVFTTPGKSILVVKNVSQDVSGAFFCVANNGIGSPDSWRTMLLIKHPPVIKSTENSTVYSDRGVTAKLYCTAEGIPDVSFSWTYQGAVLSADNMRTKSDTVKLDYVTWQGILTIGDVVAKDFGDYICVARNDVGFETTKVALVPDGAPDPPIIVRVLNTSRDAVLVTWVPGFGGGHNQTHQIRYKSVVDPAYAYIDVHPPGASSVWIHGLKPGTEYEVAMKSVNDRGSSRYTEEIVKGVTLGQRISKKDSKALSFGLNFVEVLVAAIGTVFFLMIGFNIVLLALYYRKKDQRSGKKFPGDDLSSTTSGSISYTPGSDETTFTEYSSEGYLDRIGSAERISIHSSDTKSSDSYSSDESDTYHDTDISSANDYHSSKVRGSFI